MQPLLGIHLLSLAINIPGPVAVARLRDLGASVTKIEPPTGDPLAHYCPEWYRELHAGISTLSLNLKTDAGLAALHHQLPTTDLLITASRPAALARLGLDGVTLSSRYTNLCQLNLTGYPIPQQNKAGHDLTYQAALGLLQLPAMPRTLLADLAGAERVVSTALALLLERERGNGVTNAGIAQVALSDAVTPFAAPWLYGLTQPDGPLGGSLPGYQLYPAADGWLALAALEPHFWQRLLTTLELTTANYQQLAGIFATHPTAHWQQWATTHDIPLEAVVE